MYIYQLVKNIYGDFKLFSLLLEETTMVVRRATHSGSWYTSNGHELSRELDHWLQKAGPLEKPVRAIIGK